MPLVQTRGAASAQGFGEFAQVTAVNYIEEVFSCFLYTGTASALTITNNIDLSTKGGLVWGKNRAAANEFNRLSDTVRGGSSLLFSNSTSAVQTQNNISAFNTNGFSLTDDSALNYSANSYVSWTFREQPKFFDVVTYTGTGSTQNISHNLGSVPGSIFVKATSGGATNWAVYHRSLGGTGALLLNSTSDTLVSPDFWNDTNPTSTVFTVKSSSATNSNGVSYVAYLFAHDAGGFGLTGTDNVISCGSFTTDGSARATVTLGYEPQWVMYKTSSRTDNWYVIDTMRGFSMSADAWLNPNLSSVETTIYQAGNPTATGFEIGTDGYPSETYIYIAIRKGPMAVPTVGTSVFIPTTTATAGGGGAVATTNFPVDLSIYALRDHGGFPAVNSTLFDRLRGTTSTSSQSLISSSTAAETTYATNGIGIQSNTTVTENWTGSSGYTNVLWNFRRAPSFFDEVCYTGTGSATTQTHNLGAVPELMIVKKRSGGSGTNWSCYHSALGNTQVISLNEDIQAYTASQWNNTTPTSTVFSIGTQTNVNGSGQTYVAYLFATCAGVSKVGSYTGTATTLQVNCGFTGGARFVLIKRTDEVASGNPWYVWDSARGIVAGNDPYLLLNSTAAEVTNTDYVDTYSAGFEISSTAPAAINASAGTYIFLAIA